MRQYKIQDTNTNTQLACYVIKAWHSNQSLIGGRLKQVNCNILYLIKPLVVFDCVYLAAECMLCLSVPVCLNLAMSAPTWQGDNGKMQSYLV